MADKRGRAAYAREDVEDAKRGAPATTLEPWAASRGLDYLGSGLSGAFVTVLPIWVDYLFNVCRGEVRPGQFGQVAHELEEIQADDDGLDMPGGFHSVRVHGGGGMRSLIGLEKPVANEPFAAYAAWVPTTKVVVRVPETALLPRVVIRPSDRFPLLGNPKLDDGGLPGFRMAGNQWVGDDLRLALAAAARPVGGLGAAFVGVTLDHGLLAVRRNGFVPAGPDLDALVDAAGRVAAALVEVARPLTAPQPFAAPLPAPDRASWPPGFWQPQDHEAEAVTRAAGEFTMVEEDAAVFHRTQPQCPVPGLALGVLRSTATGSRVGFFGQGGHTNGTYRTAVMTPARVGATTPLGGRRHEPTDMYVEVADGVAYAWPRVRTPGGFASTTTIPAGITTLRDLGLADL